MRERRGEEMRERRRKRNGESGVGRTATNDEGRRERRWAEGKREEREGESEIKESS